MPIGDLISQRSRRDPESQCFSSESAIRDGRLSTPTPRIGCYIALGWRCVSHAKHGPGLTSHNAKRKQFPPIGGSSRRARDLNGLLGEVERQVGVVLDGGPVYWSQPSDPTSPTVLPND